MKRLLIPVLVMCLLLCGCCNVFAPGTEGPTQAPTEAPATDATKPSVSATEPVTEPVTEPAQPQGTVTVYLVDRTDYFDSGYVEYEYDENYNIFSYEVFTIENESMYVSSFGAHNINGMPCMLSQYGEDWKLDWFEDGKIKEAQVQGDYSGYQYAYDQKGDMIEKREYYEGILQSTVYYEYSGDELWRVYCEDPEGNHIYDCRVENGIIIEKSFSLDAGGYAHFYEYDENGNLIQETGLFEGELIPIQIHSYIAVEVDADRVPYLLAQQNYLLSIT